MSREDKVCIGLTKKKWERIAQLLHEWQAPFEEDDEPVSVRRKDAVKLGNVIADEIIRSETVQREKRSREVRPGIYRLSGKVRKSVSSVDR